MAHNSNANRKVQDKDPKLEERETTAYDDIKSLQVTFYEIESWIEKTTPILTRMTKELNRASGHFDNSKRRKETPKVTGVQVVDQKELDQLLQLQQQQLLWKRSTLCDQGAAGGNCSDSPFSTLADKKKDNSMQWLLSFQPGNLLRLDTNITSVEQLIEAVQKIRLLQDEDPSAANQEDEDKDKDKSVLLYSSPVPSSTSSNQFNVPYVEYWFHAIKRRPDICLENYKHCRMDLDVLIKKILPQTLNYMGQVCWDCLHPKFCSDWTSFWERSGDTKRNQIVIDSGLAMIFFHIMRHDKDACDYAQDIAGFYYNRARDEMMEFFDDDPPDIATIEALLNMTSFCMICKRYSQARIYIGLCLQMMLDCGMHKPENLSSDDLVTSRKYFKLFLVIYFNDFNLATFIGESALISDTEITIDFYQLLHINAKLIELNKTKAEKDQVNFDNNKTLVKESYFVHTIELEKIRKKTLILITHGASIKQLLAQEKVLTRWLRQIPQELTPENHDYDHHARQKIFKDNYAIERDITSVVDAENLGAQASLMLKIQYEALWIVLHKAVLNSIRQQASTLNQLEEEMRSVNICVNSADIIVAMGEVVSRCFGWCVCQQILGPIYQASTVYCGQALVKNNPELRTKAKEMILRIMRILDTGGANHEGFPDDMTECLCEFLTNHGMHNDNVECSCSVDDDGTLKLSSSSSSSITSTLGSLDGVGIIENALLPPTHKHLKKSRHLSSMAIDDNSPPPAP